MTVEFSGPLFDGTAERLLEQGADAAELAIGEQVRESVRSVVREQAVHRTGYYESRVVLDRAQGDLAVTDRVVRYSGWLEGTWPRNRSAGFPGFHQWERAMREVEPQAAQIAERALGPYIDRMG